MKKYAPGESSQFKMAIEPGATFDDILKILGITFRKFVSLVNGRRLDKTYCFKKGDVLVMFPEISGG